MCGGNPMVRKVSFLIVMFVVVCSCANRALVYVDPAFDGKAVQKGRTAFLVPQEIDIRPVVQDFVAAFDGNLEQGLEYARVALIDCLTGERMVQAGSRGARLHFFDFAVLADTVLVNTLIDFRKNEYGIASLEVHDPHALSQVLGSVNLDYLIIFCDLVITRETSETPGGWVYPLIMVGGGVGKYVHLSAQVFIWGRKTESLLWHGFVNGTTQIMFRFTKGTVRGITQTFAGDLLWVLR